MAPYCLQEKAELLKVVFRGLSQKCHLHVPSQVMAAFPILIFSATNLPYSRPTGDIYTHADVSLTFFFFSPMTPPSLLSKFFWFFSWNAQPLWGFHNSPSKAEAFMCALLTSYASNITIFVLYMTSFLTYVSPYKVQAPRGQGFCFAHHCIPTA